ncbi:hypothetical protein [Actinomyces marmotae]|uniref:hypothetical protein n=1 Tax=Actinomyces marmotae TaxID=2737173 RepID=UPI001359E049|nr:hypothetical protein [Actinomyces marmotae]
MSNATGRTGFHVVHTKAVSERGAILDEMMRELSEESIARWAKRNPSIVVEDEHLDIALVNGGDGELVPCTDPKQVIAYGEQRLARLSSPVRNGKRDPATGKVKGGTTTTSMFALHLPKSLCREVPDFYPVLDEDGKEVGRRSRWVARDRDEALGYFEDAMEFMASQVIPGGWDAVLGADIQFSETTPHIQVLADTFAPDPRPEHEGELRCEYSRAYGSHRDVRDAKGRQMSGQAKFRKYHTDLKEYMVARGWPVEREVDPLRHDKTETKATYGAMRDERRALDDQREQITTAREELIRDGEDLEREEYRVNLARKQVEQERKAAREQGRKEGYEQGRKEGRAQGLTEGRAEAERLRRQAREQLARASALASQAAQPDEPLTVAQGRAAYRAASGIFADYLTKQGRIRPDLVSNAKEVVDRQASGEGFAVVLDGIKQRHAARASYYQRLRETIETETRDLDHAERSQRTAAQRHGIDTTQPEHKDGGMSL